MYLFKKLEQLEDAGISCPSELADLLIKGVYPNGATITEQQRKAYIGNICGVLYETAQDIKHIQNIIKV